MHSCLDVYGSLVITFREIANNVFAAVESISHDLCPSSQRFKNPLATKWGILSMIQSRDDA